MQEPFEPYQIEEKKNTPVVEKKIEEVEKVEKIKKP